MENIRSYLYIGDINHALAEHWETFGREMLFIDAVKKLYADGKVMHTKPPEADFDAWDAVDPHELRRIYDRHPLDVTDILSHPEIYASLLPESISFYQKDIWPTIHLHHLAPQVRSVDGFEIIYVMEGQCRLYLNDEQTYRTLDKGSFLLLAPNTPHDSFTVGDSVIFATGAKKSTLNTAFFGLLQTDSVLAAFFKNCFFGTEQNYLLFMAPPTPRIHLLIKNILIEFSSNRSYANEVCDSFMTILLAEVLRSYSSTYLYYMNKKSVNYQIPLVLAYIKTNFRTVHLKDTAKFFGYDADYLGKLIFQCTGMHFNDIVNTYKISMATDLLLYSNHSITEIAEMSGFNSTDHFHRTFKKLKQTTPAKYRKDNNV